MKGKEPFYAFYGHPCRGIGMIGIGSRRQASSPDIHSDVGLHGIGVSSWLATICVGLGQVKMTEEFAMQGARSARLLWRVGK